MYELNERLQRLETTYGIECDVVVHSVYVWDNRMQCTIEPVIKPSDERRTLELLWDILNACNIALDYTEQQGLDLDGNLILKLGVQINC